MLSVFMLHQLSRTMFSSTFTNFHERRDGVKMITPSVIRDRPIDRWSSAVRHPSAKEKEGKRGRLFVLRGCVFLPFQHKTMVVRTTSCCPCGTRETTRQKCPLNPHLPRVGGSPFLPPTNGIKKVDGAMTTMAVLEVAVVVTL